MFPNGIAYYGLDIVNSKTEGNKKANQIRVAFAPVNITTENGEDFSSFIVGDR
jgi:hypothetical protein